MCCWNHATFWTYLESSLKECKQETKNSSLSTPVAVTEAEAHWCSDAGRSRVPCPTPSQLGQFIVELGTSRLTPDCYSPVLLTQSPTLRHSIALPYRRHTVLSETATLTFVLKQCVNRRTNLPVLKLVDPRSPESIKEIIVRLNGEHKNNRSCWKSATVHFSLSGKKLFFPSISFHGISRLRLRLRLKTRIEITVSIFSRNASSVAHVDRPE